MPKNYAHHTNNLSKVAFTAAMVVFLGTLTSCQAPNSPVKDSKVDESAPKNMPYPSVLKLFSCKPDDAAFVAAHRGTHEGSTFPENTTESLQALAAAKVKFAEIDVARLKDGTLVLWHDGIWDRGSTGKGPIAASTWEDAQKLLTKDTNGNLTSIRPSKFTDVLEWSKDKIYLEIDFKSSVDPKNVIQEIQNAGMINQVILIAYNTDQASLFHDLAPEAAISVSIFKPGDIKALEVRGIPKSVMTGWTGRGPLDKPLVDALRSNNIPILAASFFSLDDQLQKSGNFKDYVSFAKPADLVVTDFAFDVQPVLMMNQNQENQMLACLASK
ncbi:MAG: glycerophosphodiester phosphodiesterase family protein [Hyphomonadaceae bacterium]|nr:glycerophosphodiester phosphodiesterase family protein [Hyphomonadaceae bacterium]